MSNTLAALLMGLAAVVMLVLFIRSRKDDDDNDGDNTPPPPPPVPACIDPVTGQVVPCPPPQTWVV